MENQFTVYVIGSRDMEEPNPESEKISLRFNLRRANNGAVDKFKFRFPVGHFFPFCNQPKDSRYHAGRIFFKVVIVGRCVNPEYFVGFISDENLEILALHQGFYLFEVSNLGWKNYDWDKFRRHLRSKPLYDVPDSLFLVGKHQPV